MQLAEALLHALKAHGAREIFGIPGDFALPLFKVIEESGVLPLHTLSHEPALAFAADASARAAGGLGVVAVTYGAGALNLVNAIAGAYAERAPVVVLSGAPSAHERSSGLLLHHQVKSLDSQRRIFEELTCAQAVLDDPATAPARIAHVLRACREQSLPVYLELPCDLASEPCEAVPELPPTPFDPDAVAACADEVFARLRSARAPMLMVDVEVRRYGLEARVAEIARRLGVPVVTSFMGRGLLVGTDAPLLGAYLGMAGDPDISRQVEESDCLLMLGVIVSDTNLGVSSERIDLRRVLHAFGREVRCGHHVYPHVPLAALVEALLVRARAVGHLARPSAPRWRTPVAAPAPLVADEQPVRPRDISRTLNALMRTHGPLRIAADVGDSMFTAMELEDAHVVAPCYYASMGFGVPAGLGLQAATGERVLVLVGDGAFQMTGWELGNCRRYGWDPIVVVLNNRSWELLRTFAPSARFNDLDDWHYADIAPSLGGVGTRVTTRAELVRALEQAMATRGRFHLVEVMLPRGEVSDTLARFVAGVRRLREGGGG